MVLPARLNSSLSGLLTPSVLSTRPLRRLRVHPQEVASAPAPAFVAGVIAGPRGGKVDLHDHGNSTGAVSVIGGALVEAVPWRDDTGRISLVRHELQAGATLAFGAGHVHDVTNESDEHALSLHVYSPALTSMTFY